MGKATSELQDFIDKDLTRVGIYAFEAVCEVVTEEAKLCYENIKEGTPKRTGDLKESLQMERIENFEKNKFGYSIDYKGYNEYGVAYSYIWRSLNKGTSKIAATRHIDKAVQKLKGMDDRINDRFLQKADKEVPSGD